MFKPKTRKMACVTCGKYDFGSISLCGYCSVRDLPTIVEHNPLVLRCPSCKDAVGVREKCCCGTMIFSEKLFEKQSFVTRGVMDLEIRHKECSSNSIGCGRRGRRLSYCRDCVSTFKTVAFTKNKRIICNVCNTLVTGQQPGECRDYKYCECGAIGIKGNLRDWMVSNKDEKYTDVSYLKVHRVVDLQ